MQKEILIDCRKKDLGELALKYKVGVIGHTKTRDIDVLKDYEVIQISPKDDIFDKIAKLRNKTNYVIVETSDWRVIPLENAIAAADHYSMKIGARVRNVEETKLVTTVLQKGVNFVVLDEGSQIEEIYNLLNKPPEKIKLVNGKIVKIKPIGMADRVCVDTMRLLRNLEGMLVGSQAEGLFLVESESYETPYIEPRPFRVNAGSVHEYALCPDGKTKYLSELKCGDEVCVIDKYGNVDIVNVGRTKIERRPMVLVEAETKHKRFKKTIQNAETLRLVGNTSISLSYLFSLSQRDLKRKNIYVKLMLEEAARHYGISVDTDIIEK